MNASSNALCVVEADEFDRSFHRLSPREAIITSAGADHLDIYGTHEALLQAFREYIDKLPAGGNLIIQEEIANLADHRTDISIITYGIDSGMAQAQDIRADQGAFLFNYKSEDCFIQDLKLYVPGFHNVENMVAAITIARGHGLSDAAIKKAVADFQGVKRRFEYIVKQEDRIYIDDYAHHPEEIEACLKSVRALFPDKKLSIAFQPHLFSRTQDFMEDFGKALGLADEVFLLDIYPARELPIPGVSAEVLLEKIPAKSKTLLSKEGLLERIKQDLPHLFLTLGAGDIDRLIPEIKAILQAEQAN
ncbi:UDP-N-acetylmuramate--L-alanine ligase [Persicobacter sp. CCB-QB2]|uniref:UDP-N-acetylmuramate--L-alanine ligase n=1 Tax=Persicobacter sp. CCB-QB2 TaxID=1561025 RepID=UPI00345FD6CF